eukprot:gene12603-14895_t
MKHLTQNTDNPRVVLQGNYPSSTANVAMDVGSLLEVKRAQYVIEAFDLYGETALRASAPFGAIAIPRTLALRIFGTTVDRPTPRTISELLVYRHSCYIEHEKKRIHGSPAEMQEETQVWIKWIDVRATHDVDYWEFEIACASETDLRSMVSYKRNLMERSDFPRRQLLTIDHIATDLISLNKITREQFEEARSYFDSIDTDMNGMLTTSEMTRWMQTSFPELIQFLPSNFLRMSNFTEGTTFDQFFPYMIKKVDFTSTDARKRAFDAFDANKNDYIDASELRRVLEMLGRDATLQDTTDMIDEADNREKDDQVDFHEFMDITTLRDDRN